MNTPKHETLPVPECTLQSVLLVSGWNSGTWLRGYLQHRRHGYLSRHLVTIVDNRWHRWSKGLQHQIFLFL